jgi:uncharacterized protein (DUF1778 family)
MKVRPSAEEKALFERAAEKGRRSLNQWVIVACLEKAERDGVTVEEKRGKGGSR